MRKRDELALVGAGFLFGLLAAFIVVSAYVNGMLNDYLPEYAPKPVIHYVDIGDEYPQVKLYLKMRLGIYAYSGLLTSGCMEQLMNVLSKREGTWTDEVCYDSYHHLTINLEDRFSKMTALR